MCHGGIGYDLCAAMYGYSSLPAKYRWSDAGTQIALLGPPQGMTQDWVGMNGGALVLLGGHKDFLCSGCIFNDNVANFGGTA